MPKTFSCIFVIFIIISCKKDQLDLLPEKSNTGANTFGCLIDGQAFIAKVPFGINNPLSITNSYSETDNLFLIQGNYEDKDGFISYLGFYLFITHGTGEYAIVINQNELKTYVYRDKNETKEYYMFPEDSGTIQISYFNETEHIISGEFEMSVTNIADNSDRIEITQGRFDIKY